jgi:undecaprenyl pyrophosphate phosphatase UppP
MEWTLNMGSILAACTTYWNTYYELCREEVGLVGSHTWPRTAISHLLSS